MSTHDTVWPVGTPCWVDLSVDDPEAARAFYSGLLGWDFEVSGPEYGNYGTAALDGRAVAGVASKMGGAEGNPTQWLTYLATRDADAHAQAVSAHGGQVAMPPMDVGEHGRMAVAVDPVGAVFALWQADQHSGAKLVNQPGALLWNAHVSAGIDQARQFYGALFPSYQVEDLPAEFGGGAALKLDDQMVGSIGGFEDRVDQPMWLVYFGVADVDAAAAAVTKLGGAIVREPWDASFGRTTYVTGPEGELFGLTQVPEEGYDHSDQGGASGAAS